jgi:hypothetical protein
MSGAPIIDGNGNVVGMLSGSFNTGGSLAWGIPAKQIIASISARSGEGLDIARVKWPALGSYSPEFRSFAIPRSLSISDTVDWIRAKWSDSGVKKVKVSGFNANITRSIVSFNEQSKRLFFTTEFTHIGDEYRADVIVDVVDAFRAVASTRNSSPHNINIECPSARNCVLFESKKKGPNGWRVLESKRSSTGSTGLWAMVDQDSASGVSMALNHLIQLHGAPVERDNPFR